MAKPILIGLAGLARSGKDTAASFLQDMHGLEQYALAGPLKQMLTSVFGDHFYTGDRERICPEAGISYREMMQLLGTEWGRRVNPDIWVNLMLKRWAEVQEFVHGMVVSDVRFDNEAKAILDAGGIVLRIVRDQAQAVGIQGHASEAGVHSMYITKAIDNSGSIEDLWRQLDHVVKAHDHLRADHQSIFV